MSRPQDSIIDDDEESCPLCIEEFDLTDKNFKPCPCGYQICQFCFNSLKNTYEKSTCPNCRRVYDEKTIQFKIPSKEDIVNDKENKARKQAATKRKEVEKREVETSNRRNLAGVRVKQQNLVYVIGLVPSVKDESTLLQTLRGSQYFGQYGEIDKIVVSKSKPGATSQGIGVYITYASKESAALCIEVVDGSMNGDRVLRAQYGTTKYCSAYLRGESCNNKSCTFLHETGEDGHGTTLQNEPSHPKPAPRPAYTSQPSHIQGTVRPSQPTLQQTPAASQPMRRETSKDETNDRTSSIDMPALPSTASWANKDTSAQATTQTRPGQPGGRSSTSPQVANVVLPSKRVEDVVRQGATTSSQVPEPSGPSSASKPQPPPENQLSRPSSSGRTSPRPVAGPSWVFDKLVTNINSPVFRFSFDEKAFSADELAAIERCPTMIDPYGGAKRRLMRDKEAERLRQQLDAQAKLQGKSTSVVIAPEEENIESGSLALGGEPEEGSRNFSVASAIQRPNQSSNASSSLNDQLSNLAINSRSLTPQQRQQLALLSSTSVQQAPGLGQPNQQSFGMGAFDDQRHGSFQSQQYDSAHGHARQSSRYSFANDSVKPNPAPRFPPQQQSGHTPQHFYTSGAQGPPPGLKSAGTPPISGGGMFAQGHGFTSNMNTGFGAAKDANADMLMRGRSGTGSGHDSKRGGVVDLADPGILQARMHQNAGGAGQGLFGGQNQDDQDFPPLAPPTRPRAGLPTPRSTVHSVQSSLDSPVRSSTPRVPPGLSLPHAHPSPSFAEDNDTRAEESKAFSNPPGLVTPALPILPIGHRASSPRPKVKDAPLTSKPEKESEDVSVLCSGNDNTTADGSATAAAGTPAKTTNVNLGSPKQPPPRARELTTEFATSGGMSKSGATHHFEDMASSHGKVLPQPVKVETSVAVPPKQKPGVSPSKINPQVLPQNMVATPTTVESLPNTPTAASMKSPDWAATSRPRTLRLTTTTTTTPKADAAPPSAVTERSTILSAALLKQFSRQPSLSSISRSHPSTPTVSEHGTSAEISRAGSPPSSDIVGSAPERNKSKTQTKKERKAKSKMTNESRDEESVVSTPTISEEVGPIISRQKKKKRTQEKSSQAVYETRSAGTVEPEPAATARAEKAVRVDSGKSTKKASSASSRGQLVQEPENPIAKPEPGKGKAEKNKSDAASTKEKEPAPDTSPHNTYTLNDLFADAAKLPETENALSELLNASISATSRLLQQLFESKDVDVNSAPFNAPPLSSYKLPQDSRKGADYLDSNGYTMNSPFGEIYLSGHDRKQLLQGRDVRLSDSNKPQNVLKRAMIMPNGAIFRHLSAEEEERVIELANRMQENEENYGVTGKGDLKPLDDMDFMNLTGGLEELMSFPPLHRISHLTAEPGSEPHEDADVDFRGNASDETEEDEMAPLARGFGAAPEGPMRKPMTPTTMKRKAEALMAVNLRNLDVDKLQKRIRETQVEMDAARKEMEALEKKAVRKAKDVARWREALLREIGRGMGGA